MAYAKSLNMAYMVMKGVKKITFPSENRTRTICFAIKRDVHYATLTLNANLAIILVLMSFHVTSLSVVA